MNSRIHQSGSALDVGSHTLGTALNEMVRVVTAAFSIVAERLQPRGPLRDRNRFREGRATLLLLDEREIASSRLEEGYRDSMPTWKGEFLPESAPAIDER